MSSLGSARRDAPGPSDVHVYFARPERHDAAGLERLLQLLDSEERERAARFHFERDRTIYVLAHALLRRELERYTGIAAQALRFERNTNGRPELNPAFEPEGARLRFNLAHTRGLVGCAITTGSDIGFDVEEVREPAPLEIAARFFSAPELAALRALPPEEQGRRFFTLWSLKEAYMKARGVGLALGLGCFAIEPRPGGVAELEMLAAHPPDARPWTFRWWHFETQCAAIAVQADASRLRAVVFDEELF